MTRGFTVEEVQRYARHIILPGVGAEGQRKLLDAKVLCIGTGGLGSPISMYLAAAGVGTIGLVDFDTVDLSNLQRQIAHGTSDVGRPKVESAKETLLELNPNVEVVTYDTLLSSANAFDVLEPWDVVIDGTDNFPVRYLVNDATQFLGKPLVYGSIYQFEGQATVFMPGKEAPCYRCLFPSPPPPGTVPSCAEGGVFGVLPGVIGAIQATEAIKIITGEGEPLIGRLLLYDALHMDFQEVKIRWDADCPVCGKDPSITELIDYELFCGVPAAQ
jgi:molybdopterin/thiamine biosynthesis adenylyltransferase